MRFLVVIISVFLAFLGMSRITFAQCFKEKREEIAKENVDIDLTHVPFAEDVTEAQEQEYLRGVMALYAILPEWKDKGVGTELTKILPWLEADPRVCAKWESLVKAKKAKLIGVNKESAGGKVFYLGFLPKAGTILINLNQSAYLREDPAYSLVPYILDADFRSKMIAEVNGRLAYTDAFRNAVDDFFSKNENEALRVKYIAGVSDLERDKLIQTAVAAVWSRKRALLWQTHWYKKAVARNPLIARDRANDMLEAYEKEPKKWRKEKIDHLAKAIGEEKRDLIEALWNYQLPEEFDMPVKNP